ncbi:MAG TPA: prepilin-type N-terminal cleavage/methylation domain-containing protein [Thermodesulfobacteriota bacterium]|nr:prepilin-type N-terminal cleavage/methylation domain-containing protein [Thermodesulfobacteriota bacterium]
MNDKGFTMIELMISVAIFALVIGGLTLALTQQQKQNNVTQEAVDLDQTARATLDYLSTEIRNAVSRQGKTFSLSFVNGGSTVANPCADNTADGGTEDSPPDCLTIYTWDITKGQDGENLPSIAANVQTVSPTPPLVLQLPLEWFNGNILIGETQENVNVNLGFRSRINLCNPTNPGVCGTNPELCTECAAILRATVNGATKQATIADSPNSIIAQNFRNTPYTSLDDFINNAFIPGISTQVSEMTIVQSKALRVDPANRELEMSLNGGPFQPIAGGVDAPGIVDIQYVFNLQDPDGGITKVGVPLDAANRMYPDFESDPSLVGREKDIRSVEIYLITRSKVIPQLIRGGTLPVQTIPQVGDVLERTTDHASFGENSTGVGFMYRTFSTTVYVRNMAREEFG